MIDRRRSEIRTDSATLGAVIMAMGWYASPWQPMDTLFTRVLASQGLEETWGIAMMIVGLLKVTVSVVPHPPAWISQQWDVVMKTTSISIIMVCWWTFFQFAESNLFTPTVFALGVVGTGALATLVRDALKKKTLRCKHGRLFADR